MDNLESLMAAAFLCSGIPSFLVPPGGAKLCPFNVLIACEKSNVKNSNLATNIFRIQFLNMVGSYGPMVEPISPYYVSFLLFSSHTDFKIATCTHRGCHD